MSPERETPSGTPAGGDGPCGGPAGGASSGPVGGRPRRFLESEIEQPEPGAAMFHVIPVPYERTVSYGGGTAAGPAAILEASNQLELFDGHDVPAEGGIYTLSPIDCSGPREEVFTRITAACAEAVGAGAVPVVLGGEHSLSAPAVRGVQQGLRAAPLIYGRDVGSEPSKEASARAAAAAGPALGVVQFDAHADLRAQYEGDPFSHACVMRRLVETGVPLLQLGVRAVSPEEHELRRQLSRAGRLVYQDAAELVPQFVSEVRFPDWFPELVYVTIDVDALDPAVIPATGTPEPGGIDWYQMLSLLNAVSAARRIVALDVVELAPVPGLHLAEFAAARLTYQAMGIVRRRLLG